ncbi:TPA: hypothetical protein NBO60_002711 [Staphylococcus aureus]|nr:hypothetical protein [Staphylococcus aureus]HEI7953590.1 hypothetical protein [Staphylococcus aureus]HEI7953844.1 hypothetical protein [Staphylococcus aureus]
MESNKESNKRAERYFLYNEYEKTRSLVANSKDGGLSKQDIKYLKNNLANLEKSFIDSFKNSKNRVNKIQDITKWYMEKLTSNKKIGNIKLLSEYLKMDYYYEHIYRSFSTDVHSIGHDLNNTLSILGKNLDISKNKKEKFQKEKPLGSEIELSSFTNYIVSKFIEQCANFTNDRQLWSSYKQQFVEYYKNKWNS